MTEKISILVDLDVDGEQDLAALSKQMGKVEKASGLASIQMQALEARSKDLTKKSRELGKAVADGSKSVDQAEKEFKEYKATLAPLPAITDKVKASTAKLNAGLEKSGKAASKSGKGVDTATKSIGGLTGAIGGLAAGGAIAAVTAVGAGLVAFGKNVIQTASDVEEMQSKFNTVFKDLGGPVTDELQNFADAANRSIFDLQGFAATFQDTFVPLGFARDEAAETSIELVKLAEDLASFNNLETADVVNDLQSAMVGNTETLRKYGVVANQAAIDQEALSLGLEFTKGQMDAQTKAAAILSLTMKSTTDAQGDAISTADSFANTNKGLKASFQELSAAIGTEFLPTLSQGQGALSGFVGGLADQVKLGTRAKEAFQAGTITYKEWLAVTNSTPEAANAFLDKLEQNALDAAVAIDEANGVWTESSSLVEDNTAALASQQKQMEVEEQQRKRLIDLYADATGAQNDERDAMQEYGDSQERITEILAERAAAEEEAIRLQEEAAEAALALAEAQAETLRTSGDLFTKYTEAEGEFDLASTLYSQADAAGASGAALAALGLATGALTEAQAEAALKNAALEASLSMLSEKYATGQISLDSYMQQAQAAVTDIQNTTFSFSEQAGVVLSDKEAVDQLVGSMAEIPASIQTKIDVQHNIDEALGKLGSLQAAAAGAGVNASDIHVKDGGGLGLAGGGDFIVPSSYKNDSFGPVYFDADERVIAIPKGQPGNGGGSPINGGGGMTVNNYITAPVPDPTLMGQQIGMQTLNRLGGSN